MTGMKKLLFLAVLCTAALGTLRAEIRLPDIMSGNMVLQQRSDAALWGWAGHDSRITVTVSWDKTRYTTRADGDGYWSVKVATPAADNTPQTISIRENREKPVVVENVLIGEVWFCSGQSNMFMPLGGYVSQPVEGGADMILRSGKYKNVRVALVSKRAATSPGRSSTAAGWNPPRPMPRAFRPRPTASPLR